MEELEEKYPVEIVWRSFELRPKGSPPRSPEYLEKVKEMTPRYNAIVKDKLGVEINRPEYGENESVNGLTINALVGAKYAEQKGLGPDYHKKMFRAFWLEARKINKIEILTETAVEIGLDKNDFLAALEDPIFQNQVQEDIMAAYQNGINSIPAMVFDGKFLVNGAQPFSTLESVLKQIQSGELT